MHANSPDDAILRLMTMVRYAADLPVDVIERQIASAIDIGVQIARDAGGNRYVSQVVEYRFDASVGKAYARVLFDRRLFELPGAWDEFPGMLASLPLKGVASEWEVERWKQQAA